MDERPVPRRMTIQQTLQSVFGFASFREGQQQVIEKILAGQSALAVFPTGSGKSLCYQLPALHLDGLTLVISPLIALMKDQIDFLHRRGVAAARLDSSVPAEEYRRIDADLRAGTLKLLYVAPERLSNERFIQKLRGLRIALLVIDEAHCISEWGHNFRPDYLKIARLSRQLRVERVLGLTATATPDVAEDICREFAIGADAFIHTGFYRPNLELRITPCREAERTPTLLDRLRSRPRGPTIVYVTLQRTAETVAAALAGAGFPARAYHAGLPNEERTAVQDLVHGIRRRHRRGDHCFRHGHRQSEHPLRLPFQPAQEPRKLFAGDRARRTRWRGRGVRNAGLRGRRDRAGEFYLWRHARRGGGRLAGGSAC